MSFPDSSNPYSFDDFLSWRDGVDYYADDAFLQKVVKTYAGAGADAVDARARDFSHKLSFRWRRLSEVAATPENRPFVMHYDGHGHRIDRIVRPLETLELERAVFDERIFSPSLDPWARLTMTYLLNQNGESCVTCPVACTEGMVALLERFADSDELRRVYAHITDGLDGHVGIGAQYLSEIQGGSDVPANLVEARRDGADWRIYGKKFFCSATHADYAVVTAKPTGSEQLGIFLVPSWLPGDKALERRNGFTIDRIKWKMGTSELTTAELTFDGALAYPVGPLDRGLANVVGIVLTLSRLNVGISAAASMARAAREARGYAKFRTAFGQPLERFPMVHAQLQSLDHFARRSTAGAFGLYARTLSSGLQGGLGTEGTLDERRERFLVRELIMLQKLAAAWDATDVVRSAMSIFGGHGVMEDFSVLPRLYRDAAVNELWEGPRNVLVSQIHRDMQRAAQWFPPAEFAKAVAGPDADGLSDLTHELETLVTHPSLQTLDAQTVEVCVRWDALCQRLVHVWQDRCLGECT